MGLSAEQLAYKLDSCLDMLDDMSLDNNEFILEGAL